MTRAASLLFLALTLSTLGCSQSSSTAGQKRARTASDYSSRTLAQVAADGISKVGSGEAEGNVIVTGDILPTRVRVTNTGSTRQITEARRELIHSWAARFAGSMEHYTLPYQTEYQFTENSVPYWIAVRTQSLPDFEQNFRRGETIELDLIRLGGIRVGDSWEWVLLVENFQRAE